MNNWSERELWRRQGEEYLRRVRSKPPVYPTVDGGGRRGEPRANGQGRALHQKINV